VPRKLAITLAILSPWLVAQTPSLPQFVAFDVLAVDSNSQPVADLRETDLRIEDDGRPQSIAMLRSSAVPPAPADSLKPGQYSNRITGAPPITVILLDQLNGPVTIDQPLASTFSEYIFIEILNGAGRLDPVPDLNTAGSILRRASTGNMDTPARIGATWRTLGDLAARMRAIPGRKTLIWISQGVPPEPRATDQPANDAPLLNKLAANLNQADITVYTVHPSTGAGDDETGRETLRRLAELTGGRFYPSGGLPQALAESAADARASYRLGYYPPADNWDGRFHRIRVTSRRPGIRIRTVSGYYAVRDKTSPPDRERAALDDASRAPFDASAIGLRATVTPGTKAPGSLDYQLHIDGPGFPFFQREDRSTSQLAVTFLEFDNAGPFFRLDPWNALHPSAVTPQPKLLTAPVTVKFNLNEDQLKDARENGVRVASILGLGAVDPSIHTIRILVYDRLSNEYGTLTMPAGSAAPPLP
jgi:hypothetical protein